MAYEFRAAVLDDTQAISALFRAQVTRWQRINPRGDVEDRPYDDLTLYERWLHGGAWLSVETAAIWLTHLVRREGLLPLVMLADGAIIAYAEAIIGHEPAPYQRHLHIAQRVIASNAPADAEDVLMQYLIDEARPYGQILAACSAYDEATLNFYRRYGMEPLAQVHRVTVPAHSGQGFYKAAEHPQDDPSQIAGWGMPLGRVSNARQQWEALWPALWPSLPEIAAHTRERLRFTASGQEAYVCYQQQRYDPRSAEVYAWTPKPIAKPLIIALRDWAYRRGYRTLVLHVGDSVAALLGDEAESSPDARQIVGRTVR